jgi:DNA-binding transcriptional LysR family regulator
MHPGTPVCTEDDEFPDWSFLSARTGIDGFDGRKGQVRITVSDTMSAYVLPPILKHLGEKAPLPEIDVVADTRVRNLVRPEADIAFRHTCPHQPDLAGCRQGIAHKPPDQARLRPSVGQAFMTKPVGTHAILPPWVR